MMVLSSFIQIQDAAGISSCGKDSSVTPEVEMKDLKANRSSSPLQRTLFPDE